MSIAITFISVDAHNFWGEIFHDENHLIKIRFRLYNNSLKVRLGCVRIAKPTRLLITLLLFSTFVIYNFKKSVLTVLVNLSSVLFFHISVPHNGWVPYEIHQGLFQTANMINVMQMYNLKLLTF
jgi:hypothetical protein